MSKKQIYIFIAVILFLVLSFFSGSISSSKRTKELESRASELEGLLIAETDRNKQLIAGLEEAGKTIESFKSAIVGLTYTNRQLTDRLESLGAGVSEDIETVSGVIQGIEFYIKKAEDMEEINSR